ncbi:MAG TPA: cyclic 2,3-diphosphoglycerate synthase [bacterium]|nr:cyclic 2,3-diphosphoglycerate synthase [bacterium]
MAKKVIIMGAAGRDFHNFNVYFRNRQEYQVVAFTAAQIPHIDDRRYPAELAGPLYPSGIPIFPETDLVELLRREEVDEVFFAYSDISHESVMHKASLVNACGATFSLLGPRHAMLKSKKPVVAVCAVRTGCGKSQTVRRVAEILRSRGKKVVAVRHPMPYGDLAAQKVQRFASVDDLVKHHCTIEEMEEFEPFITHNGIIYAGVDYEAILRQAEKEADVLIWDGGNNDTPFFRPDLHIVVADPLRAGHEVSYHPGETNLRMAHCVVINKEVEADPLDLQRVRDNIRAVNPKAAVVDAASPIRVDHSEWIAGRSVLVVEDGPTLTHGEMKFGAGVMAARAFGAARLVDPRPYLQGSLVQTFADYPEIGTLLPAMGYGKEQMADLQATIQATPCDAVVIGTPIDLRRIIRIPQPCCRVFYDLQEIGRPNLQDVLEKV